MAINQQLLPDEAPKIAKELKKMYPDVRINGTDANNNMYVIHGISQKQFDEVYHKVVNDLDINNIPPVKPVIKEVEQVMPEPTNKEKQFFDAQKQNTIAWVTLINDLADEKDKKVIEKIRQHVDRIEKDLKNRDQIIEKNHKVIEVVSVERDVAQNKLNEISNQYSEMKSELVSMSSVMANLQSEVANLTQKLEMFGDKEQLEQLQSMISVIVSGFGNITSKLPVIKQ